MKNAVMTIGVLLTCLVAGACYGPDEAASTLSVSIRYATFSSGTEMPGDPNTQGQVDPGAPFAYSLDVNPVVAILDVSGDRMSATSVPVFDGSGAAAAAGVITTDLDVPSGGIVVLMVTGFALDPMGAPIGFALPAPRTVSISEPQVSVDLSPEAMVSGTIAVLVMQSGTAVVSGDVFIVDIGTSIALPALRLTPQAAVGNGIELTGVPLNRQMQMYYRDSGGNYTDGGSFTLTQAWEQKTFSF